jgi:ABC-type arginine transport system permease subunit
VFWVTPGVVVQVCPPVAVVPVPGKSDDWLLAAPDTALFALVNMDEFAVNP